MEREIIFSEKAKIFFKKLILVLYTKGYFAFWDNARAYVEAIVAYAKKYVGLLPGKDAPSYFIRYGTDLKYITYKANKATSWYIFYQQRGNKFLICHITNNHVAAQHLNS